jgi:hypothetical protein
MGSCAQLASSGIDANATSIALAPRAYLEGGSLENPPAHRGQGGQVFRSALPLFNASASLVGRHLMFEMAPSSRRIRRKPTLTASNS